VLRELISAGVDCGNKSVSDATVTHVRYQRVYRRLPSQSGKPFRCKRFGPSAKKNTSLCRRRRSKVSNKDTIAPAPVVIGNDLCLTSQFNLAGS